MSTVENIPARSTRRPAKLALSYRRAEVAGFWAVATACFALASGYAAAAFAADRPWAWAASASAVALLPGAFWPPWYFTGIRVWNGSVRRISVALRRYALAVAYWTLMVAVGRSGARLDLEPPGATTSSAWRVWTMNDGARSHGLAGAMRRRGNGWLIFMAPVITLIALLSDDAQERVPSGSTYTLF